MFSVAVRLFRYFGWLVCLASVGTILGTIVVQAVGGPEGDDGFWPTGRMWRLYGTSLWMATTATVLAIVLAIPAAIALTQTRRRWQLAVSRILTVIPLLTMPSIFAYAWMLLATSRNDTIAAIMRAIGWNTPGAEPFQAAWVLATWLWPIPALVLAGSFNHLGVRAYQLARLDASAPMAFIRGALPVMRAPLMAVVAGVFILAIIDSTVPPLMGATDVWAVEMLAAASIASGYERPVGYLFWQVWPMLATIGLLCLAAFPGIRQMASWLDDMDVGDTGRVSIGSTGTWAVSCLIACGVTLFPIFVFVYELSTGRSTPIEAITTAWSTVSEAGFATLITTVCTAIAVCAFAVAVLVDTAWPRPLRLLAGVATVLSFVVAVLPPELIGTALVTFFAADWISPPDRWNLYDNTPLVWTLAMVARFGFLPITVAFLLNRRVSSDLTSQARTDGATNMQCLVYARLPILWRPLVAACAMAACLTISESACSILVQPPRFFGGSLAVYVDAQMHYGRQNETIATGLMLIVPAVLAAVAIPLVGRFSIGKPRVESTPRDRRTGSAG